MKKYTHLSGVLIFTVMGLGLPYAYAESMGAGKAQMAPAAGIDTSTMNTFVDVYADVQQIRQEYTAKLQNATGEDAARGLQEEAQMKMVQAIQSGGITVEEYNEIVQTVTSNPELMAEVEEKLEQRM